MVTYVLCVQEEKSKLMALEEEHTKLQEEVFKLISFLNLVNELGTELILIHTFNTTI